MSLAKRAVKRQAAPPKGTTNNLNLFFFLENSRDNNLAAQAHAAHAEQQAAS
jgi:hypothetical protein